MPRVLKRKGQEDIEVEDFWLSAPRFLQQVGEDRPRYVEASPNFPTKVTLPATIERQKRRVKDNGKAGAPIPGEFETVPQPEGDGLTRVEPLPPEKTHLPPQGVRSASTHFDSVPKAAPKGKAKSKSKGRAADK
jgi:hypothetical protein